MHFSAHAVSPNDSSVTLQRFTHWNGGSSRPVPWPLRKEGQAPGTVAVPRAGRRRTPTPAFRGCKVRAARAGAAGCPRRPEPATSASQRRRPGPPGSPRKAPRRPAQAGAPPALGRAYLCTVEDTSPAPGDRGHRLFPGLPATLAGDHWLPPPGRARGHGARALPRFREGAAGTSRRGARGGDTQRAAGAAVRSAGLLRLGPGWGLGGSGAAGLRGCRSAGGAGGRARARCRAVPTGRRRRGAAPVTPRVPLPAPDGVGGRAEDGQADPRTQPWAEPRASWRSRAAASPGGKMFNVESLERVELCESLLTWVGGDAVRRPPPPGRRPGISPGGRRGRRCRHIRGPGRGPGRRCGLSPRREARPGLRETRGARGAGRRPRTGAGGAVTRRLPRLRGPGGGTRDPGPTLPPLLSRSPGQRSPGGRAARGAGGEGLPGGRRVGEGPAARPPR